MGFRTRNILSLIVRTDMFVRAPSSDHLLLIVVVGCKS